MSAQDQFNTSSSEIYKKISKYVPEIEWKVHAPLIEKINKLKKDKNAVILAHNYQTPEIYHGVSDIAADSLALAVEAAKTSADIIVLCGVHFMAETAKLMSPDKKVLIPDMQAGCSLAESITGSDVRMLKDGWTAVTKDKTLSAQFEHTVYINGDKIEILTESPNGIFYN